MNTKYKSDLTLILVFLFSFVFISCGHDEMNDGQSKNAVLDIPINFVKLTDDSTNVAGFVEVRTSASQLDLRWNIPHACNIDTAQSVIETTNGKCRIPVKWIGKDEDGVYGPMNKAFDGGLLVSAGEYSRYVHLIWADEVDSIKVASQKNIVTRSTDTLPRAIQITLIPKTVDMIKDVSTGIWVEFSGTPVVYVDRSRISTSTRIDKNKIDMFLNSSGPIVLDWIDGTAPETNFSTELRFSAGNIVEIGYINYVVEQEAPAIWEFIDSTPSEGNMVLADEAKIIVQVKTNRPWSLECEQGRTSPVNDFGTAYDKRSLVMPLLNNTSPNQREIKVLVKSQGILQKTLIFTQMGQGQAGVFDFLRADPVENSNLPGESTSVGVIVQSDIAWWIKCDCGKRMDYPASALGEKTGTIDITENTTGAPRIVVITVGYGDKVVKTLNYVQNVSGAIDPNATLVYDSSTLPAGNIPYSGSNYTFTFTGTYTGTVQVRAIVDGVAQTEGITVTNKQPQCSVPANASESTRNITFEYKRADGNWIALPASTNRIQDANNGGSNPDGGNISLITISPQGDISEYGAELKASFQGDFNGNIVIRATSEGETLITATGKVNTSIPLSIPQLFGQNRIVVFEYSLDGGKNWLEIEQRNQVNETFSAGLIQPRASTISAGGQALSWSFEGTYSRAVTWRAVTAEGVLTEITGNGPTLSLIIPKNNTGKSRIVDFMYKIEGRAWTAMEYRTQPAE